MNQDEIDDYVEREWSEANRISDRIVLMLNEEVEMKVERGQVLVGLLLSVMALLGTIPEDAQLPDCVTDLKEVIKETIRQFVLNRAEDKVQ